MTRFRRLHTDRRGATIVEFALVAPIFLAALFGLLEGARMLWTVQALNETAYGIARCKLIATPACDTPAKQVDFARQRARANGIAVAADDIVIDENATCKGKTGALSVSVRSRFNSPVRGLLPLPDIVQGNICLPRLPAL
jgi:Flp pilus assembly protein TadG